MIHIQNRERLQVIDPHGMRVAVEKQMVSLLRLAKRFLCPLALCHVVKNDNATLKCAIRALEGSTGKTE